MTIAPSERHYDEALTELGKILEQTGWRPDIPLGRALDSDDGPHFRWKVWALMFLEANKERLQTVLCSNGSVRPGIGIGSEFITHITAHLSGLTWLEAALVSPVANVLCHLGLTKFCAR
jgi:hypothetical protein